MSKKFVVGGCSNNQISHVFLNKNISRDLKLCYLSIINILTVLPFSAGTDFRRQNFSRFEAVLSIPESN